MALKNPYDDEKDTAIYRVSPATCWAAIVLFLLVCTIPPLVRNITGGFDAFTALFNKPADVTLPAHLRQAEKKIEDAPFTDVPRRQFQDIATKLLREGNNKTYIGHDGMLFLRPGIEALTSTGPLQPAPLGPASDPSLKGWRGPKDAILKFADDLEERGIKLFFVPVPIKPTFYVENVTGRPAKQPAIHPDREAFVAELEGHGAITVFSSNNYMWENREAKQYLLQDTHWTPDTMRFFAEAVSTRLQEFEGKSNYEVITEIRSHIGDLVENLDLPDGSQIFSPESAELEIVRDLESGERPAKNMRSPVVVIGDSFVNIFDDPELGFGDGSGDRIGAGFAQHLSRMLKSPVDVIAINGQASTQVRQQFASRPDNQVRDKKVVVWLIAERDLFYPPKLAAENNVTWGDVTWNTESKPYLEEKNSDALVIEATLKRAATYADPSQVNYPSSTYETEWETVEGETYRIKLWAFQEREIVPSGQLDVGKTYRLKLVPEEMAEEAVSAQGAALDDLYFGDTFFGELAE